VGAGTGTGSLFFGGHRPPSHQGTVRCNEIGNDLKHQAKVDAAKSGVWRRLKYPPRL